MNSRRLTARSPDRKDSTPRHGRLLHPSSWAERDDRDRAADNFFQGGKPKIGHPTYRTRTSSPPKIVLRQIPRDGAWMNFRFSRALPQGGLAHAAPAGGLRSSGRRRADATSEPTLTRVSSSSSGQLSSRRA